MDGPRLIRSLSIAAALVAASLAFTLPALAEKTEEERIREINRENAEKGYDWIAGHTSTSGLSAEERKRMCGYLPPTDEELARTPRYVPSGVTALPSQFDWRPLGGVTPARNQGGCGSCWAFAAVGQLEAHIRIYDDRIENLSEQQCIDCNSYGADCDGGWTVAAYEIFYDPGSVSEVCYPYREADGFACTEDQCQVLARIQAHRVISGGGVPNINLIKEAVYNEGPVACAMTALDNLHYYTSGCYQTQSYDPVNHGVLIIGWDDNACSGEGAWIIKNSWGEGWGQDGFGYIKYGVCNIGTYAYQLTYLPSTIFVRVDAPNGGEILPVGEDYEIRWTTARETPDSLAIYLSLDSGTSYDSTIVTGLDSLAETYLWNVPELPVNTARLKVVAWLGGEIAGFDESDADFTIQGNPYRYVSLTGGDIYPYSLPEWAARKMQDALDAAIEGDTIMVEAGTYTKSALVETACYLLGGWSPGFTERDPSVHVTRIQSFSSVVSFMNIAGSCGIEGFTLAGGSGQSAQLPENGYYGGGILSFGSSPTIRNNIITGCGTANVLNFSAGGGIACYNGTVLIENNEITGCTTQSGGGIYLYQADAVIRNNRIHGCAPNAEYAGLKAGGGVCSRTSNAVLEGNVIHDNDGFRQGGGVYARFGTLSLDGDTIRSNDCLDSGGGIFTDRTALVAEGIVVLRNTSTATGGGITHRYQSIELTNSIVALNEAAVFGGGMYADSLWGGLANNTFDRNHGQFAGGNVFLGGVVTLDVRNNLFTFASANGFHTNTTTGLVFQYNGCHGNTPADLVGLSPDPTNVDRDPLYADTTSAALDYHLLVHSAGIDAGDPAGGTDPDGSRADLGAFGGPGAAAAAPPYVQGLTASPANDTTIDLSWTALPPAGLDHYAVYAGTEDGFVPDASSCIATVPAGTNAYSHGPVTGCLYYRVSGVSTAGYGGGYSAQYGACVAGIDLLAPVVTLLHPVGGEHYETGDTIDIAWIATDGSGVDSVSIFCSGDGGTEYTLIAHGEPNDSLFRWPVPSMNSDSCLVRVVAYDPALNAGSDESDSLFSIRDPSGTGDTYDDPVAPPGYVFSLEQNYPNPFNGTTTIAYSVGKPCRVELAVFDPAGRLVRTLDSGRRGPGRYTLTWDGRDNTGREAASGVYFLRIKAGKQFQNRKIVYLR